EVVPAEPAARHPGPLRTAAVTGPEQVGEPAPDVGSRGEEDGVRLPLGRRSARQQRLDLVANAWLAPAHAELRAGDRESGAGDVRADRGTGQAGSLQVREADGPPRFGPAGPSNPHDRRRRGLVRRVPGLIASTDQPD